MKLSSVPSVMICKSLDELEPLCPGFVSGYRCDCGKELQVSGTGQKQLWCQPETVLMCNRCGAEFTATAYLSSVVVNPSAKLQLPGSNLRLRFVN